MKKIYIIGHRNIDTIRIGLELQNRNDMLTVASRFTTNPEDVSEYKYFLDKETVNISYKNNSIITITTNDNESSGIVYDDYYNNDIFCMNLAEFNVISEKFFKNDDDVLVVWVDSSDNIDKTDINEVPFVEDRLMNINYLYFCNESIDNITDVVLNYLSADIEEREPLLKEYA